MRVLVFGGAFKTGGLVVDHAMAKGHEVTVLVGDTSKFRKTRVRVVAGEAIRLASCSCHRSATKLPPNRLVQHELFLISHHYS